MNILSLKILFVKVRRLLYDILSSIFDRGLLFLHWPVRKTKPAADKKTIVFIGEGMPPRITRLAKWLKRTGSFKIMLVAHRIHFVKQFSGQEWDEVFLFRNKFHLKRIIRQLKNISLFHAYAPKSYFPDLVRQWVKVPFIIDYQDVYALYYGDNPEFGWLKKELPHEKNCLLHADGLVAHSLEPNIVLRKYDRGKPPALFFPLYCDNDCFQPNEKILSPDDIHFVYAGGVAGSFRNKTHFGSIQFHGLIKTLSEQKIHFHIYPSPANFRADYEEYEEIARTNPWFHFHEPVKQEDLHRELSKYHFGIIPFFKKDAGLSLEKTRYATSLKLFNYIEAGIPVIVSRDVLYQSWIAERYHAGIAMMPDDMLKIRDIVCGIDYRILVAGLVREREKISLKKHIARIGYFYKSIEQAQVIKTKANTG
jgi:hypothetical protein